MAMSLESAPETALLISGVLAGLAAVRFLSTRQLGWALRAGAVGVALVVLAFMTAHFRSEGLQSRQRGHGPAKSTALVPASAFDSNDNGGETAPSTSLLLGDVTLMVAPSDRYVLSVDGREFLELDRHQSGLIVSCEVAANDRLAARLDRGVFTYHAPYIQASKPDPHTLLAQDRDVDVFRIRYAEPHRLEITGQFYLADSLEPFLVSSGKGIHWRGGGLSSGARIDLRDQGKGRVDFERSGLIQVVPY
jgi:hypothetical protein